MTKPIITAMIVLGAMVACKEPQPVKTSTFKKWDFMCKTPNGSLMYNLNGDSLIHISGDTVEATKMAVVYFLRETKRLYAKTDQQDSIIRQLINKNP